MLRAELALTETVDPNAAASQNRLRTHINSARPGLDARRIERKQMQPAMAVGNKAHDRIDAIQKAIYFRCCKCSCAFENDRSNRD